MSLFFGVFGLLLLGGSIFMVFWLLRFLALAGIAILLSIGVVSLAIGSMVFFGLYQLFGAEYGAFSFAIAIGSGLLVAFLVLRRIASEILARSQKIKEAPNAQ